MTLDGRERVTICTALSMWCNHIQTGNVVLNREDVEKRSGEPKTLDSNQEDVFEYLTNLREKVEREGVATLRPFEENQEENEALEAIMELNRKAAR